VTDPHVKTLSYTLVTREGVTYQAGAPPIERDLDPFSIRLEGGELTVTMHDHYADTAAAQAAVEPYLRAWRAAATLQTTRWEFEFKYARAEVIDRSPDPANRKTVVAVGAALTARGTLSAEGEVERASYPAPPDGFALDPDTETLWNRWQGYVEGRESLQTMAYFCLTVLELHDGRQGAAARYGVSSKVLSNLARLASETGDLATARKVTPRLRKLADSERVWLEAAVKALVRKAGEVAAANGAKLDRLTMSDLPRLGETDSGT
jgi:hypothetical protein